MIPSRDNGWRSTMLTEVLALNGAQYTERLINYIRLINIEHNQRICMLIKCLIGFLCLFSIQCIVMFVWPLPQKYRVLLVDISRMAGMNRAMNLFVGLIGLMIAYSYRTIYFSFNQRIFTILYQTCTLKHADYFLWPWLTNRMMDKIDRIYCCPYILAKSFLFFRLWRVSLYLAYLFAIYTNGSMVWAMLKNESSFYLKPEFDLEKALTICLLLISCFRISIFMILMAYIFIAMGVLFVTCTMIAFIKFDQVKSLLEEWIAGQYRQTRLVHQFMNEHTRLLIDVLIVNRIYMPLLLALLVTTIPMNAFLVVSLLRNLQQWPFMQLMFISTIIIQQWTGVFGCHLICALYTRKIHGSGPPILLSSIPRISVRRLLTQLKICNYIEKFHIKNRYGLTYGKYGLVNLNTFSKYSMIYMKFLLLAFKLTKQ